MILSLGIPFLIFILIVLHGFFANSEMAMVSSNKIRLMHLANKGDMNAGIIQNLLNNPERLFGITLVGVNITTVLASSLADYYFHDYLSGKLDLIQNIMPIGVFTLLIMEPLVLVLGELFPMALARKYPNTTSLRNARSIRLGYIILFPLTIIMSSISKVLSLILIGPKKAYEKMTRDELELMVTGGFSNITDKTQEYIKKLFDFNELIASDVMVHISNVTAIDEKATVKEAKTLLNKTIFTKMPVYRESVFDIAGTIHAADMLGAPDNEPVAKYMDKLYIVPRSKPVLQILSELKRNRKYMGIVVDEYGVSCGIITLEDILEELIGDINDEYDPPSALKKTASKNILNADMRLDEFYDLTGIDLSGGNAETLSGIITLAAGRIPRKKEIVKYKNIEFEIIEATDRVVKVVKLIKTY